MAFEYLKSIAGGMDRNAILHDLMVEYGQDVWNYAYVLTNKIHLADDISQDVFIRAFEHMSSYRGQCSVKTWLLAITRNRTRDYWRSSWLKRVVPFADMPESSESASAERVFMDGLANEQVWVAVLSLPRKLREVLLLYAHHGLAYAEIADLLGVSEGTVKSRLFRARAKVSRTLGEEDNR